MKALTVCVFYIIVSLWERYHRLFYFFMISWERYHSLFYFFEISWKRYHDQFAAFFYDIMGAVPKGGATWKILKKD